MKSYEIDEIESIQPMTEEERFSPLVRGRPPGRVVSLSCSQVRTSHPPFNAASVYMAQEILGSGEFPYAKVLGSAENGYL